MQVDFSDKYVKKENKRGPKFRVEEKGAVDRIVIVSPPELYYVHSINMPIIDPQTGEKVKETRESPNGNTWEVDKEEFVSEMLCKGDPEVVSGPDGVDPEGCQLCAAYVENAGKFKRPTPKYACVVARYKTGPAEDTTPQTDPFQAEALVWVLTQKRFEKVIAIAREHGDPVGKLDLLCGPCKNVKMHNYEIAAAGKCLYAASEEARDFIHRSVKSSGITEEVIKSTIANVQTEVGVKMALNKVLERYALEGHGAVGGGAVDVEFNALAVDSHKAAESASDGGWGAASSDTTPDFLDKPTEASTPPEESPKAEATASDTKTPSLDDILAGL